MTEVSELVAKANIQIRSKFGDTKEAARLLMKVIIDNDLKLFRKRVSEYLYTASDDDDGNTPTSVRAFATGRRSCFT